MKHMRVLEVKQKSVKYDGYPILRYVMAQRFKKNGYTHVRVAKKLHNASVVSGLVWIGELCEGST